MGEIRDIGKPHRKEETVSFLKELITAIESGEGASPTEVLVCWSDEEGGVFYLRSGDLLALTGLMEVVKQQLIDEG